MTETSPGVQRLSQSLEPGTLVSLYTVDVSPLGVPQMWHFTNGTEVQFRGVTYSAADVEVEGFEWNGQGAMPRPKIRVSNSTRMLSGIARTFNDLVGARFIRIRTYAQFLDGMPSADPAETFGIDIFSFEQKVAHDKYQIEWVLSAAMDQQGRMIPGRKVIRDVCMWRYRHFKDGAFDYSKVECPYTGAASFDRFGEPTTAENDRCGKRISDCEKRFGNGELPYGGFPGVARVRL